MTGAILCLTAVMFEENTGNQKNVQKTVSEKEKKHQMQSRKQQLQSPVLWSCLQCLDSLIC